MSDQESVYDVIIIGGGPAGLAAAIYGSRSRLRTLVIDKNPAAGALNFASRIENYPGIPESITGSELLSRIRRQAEHFGAEIIRDEVVGANLNASPREIMTKQQVYKGTAIIICSGAMGRSSLIKGETEYIGKGVAYCAECDAPLFADQDVVVTGNPELFQEELAQITGFARHVYLIPVITHGTTFDENTITDPKIEIMEDYAVIEISGDTLVSGVLVKNKTGDEKMLEASGIFLYLHGRIPVVNFLGNSVATDNDGCIAVNRTDMSMPIDGVYAAGDVTCKNTRQSIFAAAEGSQAAVSSLSYINKKRKSGDK